MGVSCGAVRYTVNDMSVACHLLYKYFSLLLKWVSERRTMVEVYKGDEALIIFT